MTDWNMKLNEPYSRTTTLNTDLDRSVKAQNSVISLLDSEQTVRHSVLKSGPVWSFAPFWRQLDCYWLWKFYKLLGPQPNHTQPVVYGCPEQL